MLTFLFVWTAAALPAAAAERYWPVEIPITMEKNLPLAQIRINGEESLTFILDSAAAGCVIDRERAAALGLSTGGTAISSGSGGAQEVGVVRGVRLEIGGIDLQIDRVFGFDMKALRFEGQVDGILGYPLFGKYVVEIDYPGSRVRIYPPQGYRPPAAAQVIPMRMTVGPTVRGTIRVRGREPIEADMQLDTGSAHVLTICTPFVDRHNLLDSAEELVEGSTLGFGGRAADVVGRIEEVRIGRFRIEKPQVRLSRQSTGSFATERHYSANLGGDFMRRHKVTFDIPGSRVMIE